MASSGSSAARRAAGVAAWTSLLAIRVRRYGGLAFATLVLVVAAFAPSASASGRPLIVDDDGRGAPGDCNATQDAFASVQAAVDAARPGETISVCPGTYAEQVAVRKDRLRIVGAGTGQTTLRPSGVTTNTIALRTGLPSVALMLIDGVSGVTVRGLTVDGGAASLPSECPPYFGVFYRDASGTVDSVRVTGVLPCVSVGIFAQSPIDGSGSAHLTVRGSRVDDYGAAGIICNELGTDCTLKDNVIAERGDVPISFPVGIQIGFNAEAAVSQNVVVGPGEVPETAHTGILITNAQARVSQNVVRGNLCTLDFCGPDPVTQGQISGIFAFQARQGTVISGNEIGENDAGIYLAEAAGCCEVTANRLDNRFYGIGIQDGSNTTTGNQITGGNYGVVALAFAIDTVATSRADRIRDVAIAPTAEFSCCGVTAEVRRIP